MAINLTEQKKREIEDKIRRFEYFRQNRVAFYQSIFTGVLALAIALIIDLLSPVGLKTRILIILILIVLSYYLYKKSLEQTQKPISIAENLIGTLEKSSEVTIKGEKFAIIELKDVIYKPFERKK